jgi:hypothetical protein
VAATEKGLPALCGVEPLLTKELGSRYNPHYMGTNSAGVIMGELMRHLGYAAAAQAKRDGLKNLHIGISGVSA